MIINHEGRMIKTTTYGCDSDIVTEKLGFFIFFALWKKEIIYNVWMSCEYLMILDRNRIGLTHLLKIIIF